MKRSLVVVLLLVFAVPSLITAAPKKKKKAGPCASSLATCPDTGCGGTIDKNLNKRKNIKAAPTGAAEDMTIAEIKALEDPVEGFKKGDKRDKLTALGEGKLIRVVAQALVVRTGSKESCNCGLTGAGNTDNHIVLIDPADDSPSLEDDEPNSVTAEFTPRVRKKLPELSRTTLKPLIDDAPNGALKVRVTGLLMFDSEHSLGHHLKRHNNWEIHPIFLMEYCPTDKKCSNTGLANWKHIGQQ
jgi:hypothetical protein